MSTPSPSSPKSPSTPPVDPRRIPLIGQILSGLLSDSAFASDGHAGIAEAVTRARKAASLVLSLEAEDGE